MTTVIVALLIVVGFIFFAIELFIVPGFSVPGIAGIIMIGYGIFMSSKEYGISGVFITIAVSVATALILIRIALKSRALKYISLDYSQKGNTAVDDYSFLIDKRGKSLSHLRPSGTANIEGNRYDVVTDGEYIEENSDIIVQEIDGTRIIVTLSKRR